MVDLKSKSAGGTLFPISIGRVEAREVSDLYLTQISAKRGQQAAAEKALQQQLDLEWPKPGQFSQTKTARAQWFDHQHILIVGAPAKALEKTCWTTDVSDGWITLRLIGPDVRRVLARLTPIDLRSSAFKKGMTARTDLMHMQAAITCLGPDEFEVMVFRSMAQTLAHDLTRAMESVAALREQA